MVESGYGVTSVTPIYCGNVLKHGVEVVSVGTEDIAQRFAELIRKCAEQEIKLFGTAYEHARMELVEKMAFLSLNFAGDMEKCHTRMDDINLCDTYVLSSFRALMLLTFIGDMHKPGSRSCQESWSRRWK